MLPATTELPAAAITAQFPPVLPEGDPGIPSGATPSHLALRRSGRLDRASTKVCGRSSPLPEVRSRCARRKAASPDAYRGVALNLSAKVAPIIRQLSANYPTITRLPLPKVRTKSESPFLETLELFLSVVVYRRCLAMGEQ